MVLDRTLPILLLVVTFTVSKDASAYIHEVDRYGARIKWATPELTVRIAASASSRKGIERALTLAADAYNALHTDERTAPNERSALRFVVASRVQGKKPEGAVHVVINSRIPPKNAQRFLAVTEVETGRAGAAKRATIWLNETLPMSLDPKPTEADLVSVLVHELGHAAGLGHSRDRRAAMHGGVHNGERAHRTLKEDDIRGITALYKPGGAARVAIAPPAKSKPMRDQNRDPAPKCDCILARSSPPATMGFALVAGALFCGARRKRRRRSRA